MRALILLALISALMGQSPAGPPKLDIPTNMKQYFVGLLLHGEKAHETLPKEQEDGLMQKHLAYIRTQVESGYYLLAGPMLDNGRIGGMVVINVPDKEQARRIAEGDPMIKSGRMSIEIHPAMLPEASCLKMDYPAR